MGAATWLLAVNRAPQPTGWVIADLRHPVLAGERVRTAPGEHVALESDEFGRIELQPGSEIRVMEASPGRQRMHLQKGTLHALIWAPPRQFVVDTPSARAIDLGCRYDLSVDDRGDGFLRVQTGWVAFQNGSRESFIPAGAACRTTKARGPGIPYYEDAAQDFRSALERVEREGDHDALLMVLAKARTQDGLTLWHLLSRVDATQRGAVFDRFAQLVPLPPAVLREKALAGDSPTLDLCWSALGLADAEWWREWKQDWR